MLQGICITKKNLVMFEKGVFMHVKKFLCVIGLVFLSCISGLPFGPVTTTAKPVNSSIQQEVDLSNVSDYAIFNKLLNLQPGTYTTTLTCADKSPARINQINLEIQTTKPLRFNAQIVNPIDKVVTKIIGDGSNLYLYLDCEEDSVIYSKVKATKFEPNKWHKFNINNVPDGAYPTYIANMQTYLKSKSLVYKKIMPANMIDAAAHLAALHYIGTHPYVHTYSDLRYAGNSVYKEFVNMVGEETVAVLEHFNFELTPKGFNILSVLSDTPCVIAETKYNSERTGILFLADSSEIIDIGTVDMLDVVDTVFKIIL